MKILLICEPGCDGVFSHVEGLAHYLCDCGLQVHLAYSSIRRSDRLDLLLHKIHVCGGETLDLMISNKPGVRDLIAFAKLYKFVDRLSPDIIHAHSSKAGALARVLTWIIKRRCVIYTPNAYYGISAGNGLAKLFSLAERCLAHVGTTINVSPDEMKFALEVLHVPAERCRYIPNGIDAGIFKMPSREEQLVCRDELGLPRDGVLLGTVGRMTFQKDPETLYSAFAQVVGEIPDLYLCHLGQGEMEAGLRNLSEKSGMEGRVFIKPYLKDPEKFYQALDSFILTSRYEGLPISALEALATGLPLILSKAPGNSLFGMLGLSHLWMATPGEPKEFASAIKDWYRGRTSGKKSNHRQTALDRFSAKSCHEQIFKLYMSMYSSHIDVKQRFDIQ